MAFSQTETFLLDKYKSLTLDTRALADVFGLSYKSLLNAISAERFPVHTYKIGKSRVADVRDVAAFLDRQRNGGF